MYWVSFSLSVDVQNCLSVDDVMGDKLFSVPGLPLLSGSSKGYRILTTRIGHQSVSLSWDQIGDLIWLQKRTISGSKKGPYFGPNIVYIFKKKVTWSYTIFHQTSKLEKIYSVQSGVMSRFVTFFYNFNPIHHWGAIAWELKIGAGRRPWLFVSQWLIRLSHFLLQSFA